MSPMLQQIGSPFRINLVVRLLALAKDTYLIVCLTSIAWT